VERGHVRRRLLPRQREVQVIEMPVDEIEATGMVEDPLQHQHMRGQRVAALQVSTQGGSARGHEAG
jgi:hypothetical protein